MFLTIFFKVFSCRSEMRIGLCARLANSRSVNFLLIRIINHYIIILYIILSTLITKKSHKSGPVIYVQMAFGSLNNSSIHIPPTVDQAHILFKFYNKTAGKKSKA